MDRKGNRTSRPGNAVTKIFALLLIICLVECATEQRINNRGSKTSNIVEKVNGWRSQRGGSCLSYGHSCWGAHGKRSGKPPGSAPDWYLSRLLRRMAASAELVPGDLLFNSLLKNYHYSNRMKQLSAKHDDINAIYQLDIPDDLSTDNKLIVDNDEGPIELPQSGNLEAKPMLDENLLSKMKLWQIMRASPEEN